MMSRNDIATLAANTASRTAFVEALEADGFSHLGGGHFADAYGRGKKFVVKVGKKNREEDGYVAYAQWLASHAPETKLPEFPRISAFIQCTGWYVVILERLDELTEEAKRLVGVLSRRTRSGKTDEELIEDAWDRNEKDALRDLLPTLPESTRKACQLIREKFLGEWGLDMHKGNFLMRGSQIVITDPLSFRV